MVKSLHDRINQAQSNLAQLFKRMDIWADVPALVRRDVKHGGLLPVNDRRDYLEKRYQVISNDAVELLHVLADNYDLYFDLVIEVANDDGKLFIYFKNTFLDNSNGTLLFQRDFRTGESNAESP